MHGKFSFKSFVFCYLLCCLFSVSAFAEGFPSPFAVALDPDTDSSVVDDSGSAEIDSVEGQTVPADVSEVNDETVSSPSDNVPDTSPSSSSETVVVSVVAQDVQNDIVTYTIFNKPFNEYTPTEGFLFLLFVVVMLYFTFQTFTKWW